MELVNPPNNDFINTGPGKFACVVVPEQDLKNTVDEMFSKVDQLEKRVYEIEEFYSISRREKANISTGGSVEKDKPIPSMKKLQLDASRREAAASKRMQEIMRHFGSVFRQITQHKLAWPFIQPVDVAALGLHDYYKIIDRPMDFSTIKNQMEAKDGAGYKHVREIYSDVVLVFQNAMKYNDDKSDVYGMAKTLLEKFEEKWLQFIPRVLEEEDRRKMEEAEAQINVQLAQEAAQARLARDLNNELYDVDMHIEELREMAVKKCRHISIVEKRSLGIALTKLSPEDLSKVLDIVAENDPKFQATAEEVELDINAQSESTLWRLKFFVKDVLMDQCKSSIKVNNKKAISNHNSNIVSKRKREICDALSKTAKRRKKKSS